MGPPPTKFYELRDNLIDALRELNVGDYVRDYCGWSDGSVCSALIARPRKSLHWQDLRAKALTPEVEDWLIEYLDHIGYARLARGDDGRTLRKDNGRPLDWTVTVPPDYPLWISRWTRRDGVQARDECGRRIADPTRLSAAAMYNAIAGARWPGDGPASVQTPLIVHLNGRGEWHGYSPQAFRHATTQIVTRAAWDIRTSVPALAHWQPQDFADALTDHSFLGDNATTYGDKERNRDYAARLAAFAAWELMWGDAGAIQVSDTARILRANETVAAAFAEVARIKAAAQAVLVDMDGTDQDPPANLAGDDLARFYGHASRRDRGLTRRLVTVQSELGSAMQRHADACSELALALEARVPLDDLVDLDALDVVDVADEATLPATDMPTYRRGWISAAEAAECFDVSIPTMERWARGAVDRAILPWAKRADGKMLCPPWEQATTRGRRLWIIDDGTGRTCLDPSRVAPEIMERIMEVLAA